MILHRALLGLLRRAGLSQEALPDDTSWPEFLRLASQEARANEDEQFRLERSLEVHTREVQALYEALREERRRLSLVLSGVREGLLLLDPELNVVLASPEVEHLTGHTERELVGHPLDDSLSLPAGWRQELARRGRTSGRMGRAEYALDALDSGDYLMHMRAAEGQPWPEAESAPEEPTREDAPAERLSILLVEDDPGTQLMTQQMVEELGHACLLAEDANEALKVLRRQAVDVIVASHATGGIELCRKIRTSPGDSTAYFLLLATPEAQEEARKGLDQGVDGLLVKPVDAVSLSARLRVARSLRRRLSV